MTTPPFELDLPPQDTSISLDIPQGELSLDLPIVSLRDFFNERRTRHVEDIKNRINERLPDSPRTRGYLKSLLGVVETFDKVKTDPLGTIGGIYEGLSNAFENVSEIGVKESIKIVGKSLVELVELPFEAVFARELDFLSDPKDISFSPEAFGIGRKLTDEELEKKFQHFTAEVAGFAVGFGMGRVLHRGAEAVKTLDEVSDIAHLAVKGATKSQTLEIVKRGMKIATEAGLAGGTTGILTGDTPEERLNNAVAFGITAAAIGGAIGAASAAIPILKAKVKGEIPQAELLANEVVDRQTVGILKSLDVDESSGIVKKIINGELLERAVQASLRDDAAIVMRNMSSTVKKGEGIHLGPDNSVLIAGKGSLTAEQFSDFKKYGFFRGQLVDYYGSKTRINKIQSGLAELDDHVALVGLDNLKPTSEVEFYRGRGKSTVPRHKPEGFDDISHIDSEVKRLRHNIAKSISQKAFSQGYYMDFSLTDGGVKLRDIGTENLVGTFRSAANLDEFLNIVPAGNQAGLPKGLTVPPEGIQIPPGVVPPVNETFLKHLNIPGKVTSSIEGFLGRSRFFNTLPRMFSELDRITGSSTTELYFEGLRRQHRSYVNTLNDRLTGINRIQKEWRKLSDDSRFGIARSFEEATIKDIEKKFIIGRRMNVEEIVESNRLSRYKWGDVQAASKHIVDGVLEKKRLRLREIPFDEKAWDTKLPDELKPVVEQLRDINSNKKVDTRAILRRTKAKLLPSEPTKLTGREKAFKILIDDFLEESKASFGDDVRYRYTLPRTRKFVDQEVSEIFGDKLTQDFLYTTLDDGVHIDPYDAAIAFARRRAKASKIGDLLKETSDGVKEVRFALRELKRKAPQKMVSDFNQAFNDHLAEMRGNVNPAFGEGSTNAAKKVFNKLFGVSGDTFDDLSRALTQSITVKFIGFRPILGARDLLSPFLDYFIRFGVRRTKQLIQHTINLDKIETFRAARRGELQTSLNPILAETGGEKGTPTGILAKGLDVYTDLAFDLTGQRVMFDRMKAAVYAENKANTWNEITRHLSGEIDAVQLSNRLKLNTYDPAIAQEFRALLKLGDNQSIKTAVERLSATTSFDANLDYGMSYAMPSYRTALGRAAGQFGQWPLGKMTVLNRYLRSDVGSSVRLAGAFGAMYLASQAVDYDLRAWYFTPLHMSFLGGPMFEESHRIINELQKANPEGFFKAIGRLMPIPTSAISDFESIIE